MEQSGPLGHRAPKERAGFFVVSRMGFDRGHGVGQGALGRRPIAPTRVGSIIIEVLIAGDGLHEIGEVESPEQGMSRNRTKKRRRFAEF